MAVWGFSFVAALLISIFLYWVFQLESRKLRALLAVAGFCLGGSALPFFFVDPIFSVPLTFGFLVLIGFDIWHRQDVKTRTFLNIK